MNKFEQVLSINVNDKTEKKGGLTYLSWAFAWQEFKKVYPEAKYKIKKFGENQLPYVSDETGYMVFTEVEAEGVKHEMWLPVMDFKNKALKVGEASMFDVNKAIMRCLTKNLAMFGLGLYIYAGEDLPEADNSELLDKIAIVDSINDIKELREFYQSNKGLGKEFNKYVSKRKAELEV